MHYIVVFIIFYVLIVNFIINLLFCDIDTFSFTGSWFSFMMFKPCVKTSFILIFFLYNITTINCNVFNIKYILIDNIWCFLLCII